MARITRGAPVGKMTFLSNISTSTIGLFDNNSTLVSFPYPFLPRGRRKCCKKITDLGHVPEIKTACMNVEVNKKLKITALILYHTMAGFCRPMGKTLLKRGGKRRKCCLSVCVSHVHT